jgi:hypothetical protein
LLDEYEKIDKRRRDDLDEKRQEIIDRLEDMAVIETNAQDGSSTLNGGALRWGGEFISPDSDSDYFYEASEPNSENVTTEVITGGRFEVVSVERGAVGEPVDPPFISRVRLRQVGVFDPTYPGKLVKPGGESEMVKVKALHVF